jgi:hypothetical protein
MREMDEDMANIKPIKINLTLEQALRRALSVPAPEHDPKPPKAKKKAGKRKKG